MEGAAQLEECLAEALSNLYNPTFQPAPALKPLLHLEATASQDAVRLALIDAIEGLKPPSSTPDTSEVARLHRLLRLRYIEGLTQREVAERLNLSERHLRREQQRAVESLLQRLGQQRPNPAPAAPADMERTAQIRRELTALMQSAPGEMSDVGAVISSAIKISAASSAAKGVALRSAPVAANLLSAIHRAVLREVMITAIERMVAALAAAVPGTPQGAKTITVGAEQQGGMIAVTISGAITGGPVAAAPMPASSLFVNEAIAAAGGATNLQRSGDSLVFTITLPAADRRRVLVLEDNTDLVHMYRRYAAATRYEIVHVSADENILEVAQAAAPDVILMDILLPNVDGWELLNLFHEHPATRPIPVIICSVVRREELSLALGAELYLQKPVSLPQFIQALDLVSQRAAPRR